MLESVRDSKTTAGLHCRAITMSRGLFSFHRLAVLWAGMCLSAGLSVFSMLTSSNLEASAFQETSIDVTLNSVNGALPNSYVEVDIQITWSDSIDTLFVDGFSFAIAYDAFVLQLYDVLDHGLRNECSWFFGYVQAPIDSSLTQNMFLKLVGENTSQTDCFTSGERTITLQFSTKGDSSLYGVSTSLDFYWDTCCVNLFWKNDPDTAMLALTVFDADSVEITDENHSLPSFTGPHWSCFDPSVHDGDAVVRSVCFHSGKIEFEALTDVVENQDNKENHPATVNLRQNYPNPFNPSTTIEFYLPVRSAWRLEIINLKGQVVTEFRGVGGPGSIVVLWDGQDSQGHPVSSGVYLYRLQADNFIETKKMILLK
jgi:hypothetical protein